MVSGRDRDPAFRKKASTTRKAKPAAKPAAKAAAESAPKASEESAKTEEPKSTASKTTAAAAPAAATQPASSTTSKAVEKEEFKPSTVEKPKPVDPKDIPPPTEKELSRTSRKSKALGILVAILFIIGLVALGYMVIQNIMEKERIENLDDSFSNEGVDAMGPNSTDVIDDGENEEGASSTESENAEGDSPHEGAIGQDLEEENASENSETELSKDNSMETEMKEAKEEHADKSASTQEKEAIKSKIIRKKGEFEIPSWIIAFSANSKKPLANTNYSTLEALGYDAGIYWIPKYFPGGKEMYKVYVGPYRSLQEAESMLPAIRNLQPDAYVLKIDE